MKLLIFPLIILATFNLSCKKNTVLEEQKDKDINEKVEINYSFLNDTLIYNPDKYIIDLKIIAKGTFSLSNSGHWLKILGIENDVFNLEIDENQTSQERIAHIYLHDAKKIIIDTLTIIQKGIKLSILVNIDKIPKYTDKLDKTLDIPFYANVPVSIHSDSDWLTGQAENTKLGLEIICDKNEGTSERTGQLTIKPKDSSFNEEIKITIIQKETYGRYSDSIALLKLIDLSKMANPSGIYYEHPWKKGQNISTMKYIVTETISGELRVTGINISSIPYFHIQLPDEMKYMSELKSINIYSSTIIGGIFSKIKENTKIKNISLNANGLNNENLEDLYTLHNLESFKISTGFTGSIKNEIGNLKKLKTLHISNTNISGNLPDGFYDLQELDSIRFVSANITGQLSEKISNFKKLRYLALIDNIFQGHLPNNIGNLPNLEELIIMQNNFTGTLPNSITNLSKIKNMTIESTKLEGRIPENFENLQSLLGLNLSNNKFNGAILQTLYKLPALKSILLNNNKFSGEIEKEIRNLKHLNHLQLSNNLFSGAIPVELIEINNLNTLKIANNNFSGYFPDEIINYHKFGSWSPKSNIIPQNSGFGFSNLK